MKSLILFTLRFMYFKRIFFIFFYWLLSAHLKNWEWFKICFTPVVSGWALLDHRNYLLRGGGLRSGRISLGSKQSFGCALRLVYLRITSSCWTAEVAAEQNPGDHILPRLYHILPHNPHTLPLHTLQPTQEI